MSLRILRVSKQMDRTLDTAHRPRFRCLGPRTSMVGLATGAAINISKHAKHGTAVLGRCECGVELRRIADSKISVTAPRLSPVQMSRPTSPPPHLSVPSLGRAIQRAVQVAGSQTVLRITCTCTCTTFWPVGFALSCSILPTRCQMQQAHRAVCMCTHVQQPLIGPDAGGSLFFGLGCLPALV
jgi:hypothetical protein